MNQTIEEIETKETAQAASINQKYGYSTVIGEHHRKSRHHIAEFVKGQEIYRLKTVEYQYFDSEKELLDYCSEKRIHIKPEQEEKRTPAAPPRKPLYNSDCGLTEKQLRFCNAFLLSGNATQAYMIANPNIKNANSAAACASTTLKKPQVRLYLEQRGFRK